MDDLYREVIIERNKSPQFKGELDPHDYSYADENPLCGDNIRVDLRMGADGKVAEAAFSGHGCAISQASALFGASGSAGGGLMASNKVSSAASALVGFTTRDASRTTREAAAGGR